MPLLPALLRPVLLAVGLGPASAPAARSGALLEARSVAGLLPGDSQSRQTVRTHARKENLLSGEPSLTFKYLAF